MKYLWWGLLVLLGGCGRYGEFGLPAPERHTPRFELMWRPEAGPVMPRGTAVDVLNPSVVRWKGSYLNLYSVFDGRSWSTRRARSADGIAWTEEGTVVEGGGEYIAANGAVLEFQGALHYVFQAGPKGRNALKLARSRDGENWEILPEPVLRVGPRMSWDEVSIGDPYLLAAGGQLYLFYLGEDRARRQRLGLARSLDGVNWTKKRGPLLELGGAGDFDENGLGEAAVFPAGGKWVMLYTGRDRRERRAMGYAISEDGEKWVKLRQPVLRGEQAWNSAVVCDATVLVEEGRVRIWFGGGDQARPDERLNGQIGYAELVKLN
ncbi:MAG: hypothetical protein ACK5ZJ_08130 [Acidobacteriota bacterium]